MRADLPAGLRSSAERSLAQEAAVPGNAASRWAPLKGLLRLKFVMQPTGYMTNHRGAAGCIPPIRHTARPS
jgi:hypothetical protein